MKMTAPLRKQLTAIPTRKMTAVGITSLLGPVIAGFLAPYLPGLSEACGGELGASLLAVLLVGSQGLANFVSGYMTKSRDY